METDFRGFFLLVETIIEIRQNPISARGNLFSLRETDFLVNKNLFFFLHFSWKKRIFQQNSLFRLVETHTNSGFHKRQKAGNKRIPFPLDKNFDSISRNEGFVKKVRFHCAGKLLSLEGISRKIPQKTVSSSRREVTP